MKKAAAFIAAFCLCMGAAPFQLLAGDSSSPTPATTVGKNHMDVNKWLDGHPKLKAIALAKFDKNHNGILDGDEIPAFLKWLKERREKRKDLEGDGGQTTKTTPPAITSPIVSQ
jgi:hypothetical protein